MPSSDPNSLGDDSVVREVYSLLAGIIGGAEVLRIKYPNDVNVEQIQSAARRMVSLTEPLLKRLKTAEPALPRSREPEAPDTFQRRGVLYIEDQESIVRIAERVLEKRPHLKLFSAQTGTAGLQLARAYRPEAILLDLDLPDMHGSDVLERLQESPDLADVPVIVVSGDNNSAMIERLLAAGARDYLIKPIHPERLLLALDTLFQRDTSA